MCEACRIEKASRTLDAVNTLMAEIEFEDLEHDLLVVGLAVGLLAKGETITDPPPELLKWVEMKGGPDEALAHIEFVNTSFLFARAYVLGLQLMNVSTETFLEIADAIAYDTTTSVDELVRGFLEREK